MKKIIAFIMTGIMVMCLAHPIYAAENELSVQVQEEAEVLMVTPKLKIPHIVIQKITPKFNFTIDFSKYIPRLF